ncbi:Permease of the drug/metabolite transporter (DMT) superfamily [Micromonospora haikouensis]|uniref:Permease of the drug/metabolite transporter (DMT) superfamily n=1 Tax=Micromonospora haikouensis TaxID=686309 RepID=A0A1C4X7I1_9ACTN|nr:DMT family transporter [Micromonospora haikouensis]SCF04410.1 Permease of the drug/metabolite transporter (DMT) superfamily [Micromonospora haikouensis]
MPVPHHHRPVGPLTGGVLALAVLAVSSSAPLVAFAAAPALAIAFWRNLLAVGVLGPFALARRRAEFRALTRSGTGREGLAGADREGPVGAGRDGRAPAVAGRREGWLCVLSGMALAAHFATWMPSVQLTSVAAAVALVATQPAWQGLIARGQGRRLPPAVWVGIAVAVAGAVLASGADFAVSGRAFAGDLLAVAGGLFAAVYTALGERARVTVSTTTYTTICYGVCALILLAVCLVGGVPLGGYDTGTWLAILGLVAGAQLLGHSMFNYALRRVSATTVSMLILLEAPGAALIAWAWLGQLPRVGALPGLALILAGVTVVVLGGSRAGRRTVPAPLPVDAAPLAADTGTGPSHAEQ